MSGRMSRSKGYRGEKQFRDMCADAELKCIWCAEDPDHPDVKVNGYRVEVKYRAGVPQSPYDWLHEKKADMVAMKRVSKTDKGREWLMVMPFHVFRDMQHRILELETLQEINESDMLEDEDADFRYGM